MPQTTREEQVTAGLETWRVLNGDALPFDEPAARRFVEASYDRAANFAAAVNHDRAGRQMTPDRFAPLSKITAPALVIHGTEDPLRPLPHGQALAAQIPRCPAANSPRHGTRILLSRPAPSHRSDHPRPHAITAIRHLIGARQADMLR